MNISEEDVRDRPEDGEDEAERGAEEPRLHVTDDQGGEDAPVNLQQFVEAGAALARGERRSQSLWSSTIAAVNATMPQMISSASATINEEAKRSGNNASCGSLGGTNTLM